MATSKQPTEIRVGQRLIHWDGMRGYVWPGTEGKRVYQQGESFRVRWTDPFDGSVEDEFYTLADFEEEGIRFGKGVMPWAK